jgi:cathepsin A (carboxypeptidase C)
MRAAPLSLLLAGSALAAASPPFQQPLGLFHPPSEEVQRPILDKISKPIEDFKKTLKGLSNEARKAWDEVSFLFPEAFDPKNFFSLPKPHQTRPDHEWDVITKGEDLQAVWIEGANGEKHREIDGHLNPYSLRTKKVDPSALGIDSVKQYSGYLDDDETDKHLFYCKAIRNFLRFC